jgi:hypothetical protein
LDLLPRLTAFPDRSIDCSVCSLLYMCSPSIDWYASVRFRLVGKSLINWCANKSILILPGLHWLLEWLSWFAKYVIHKHVGFFLSSWLI